MSDIAADAVVVGSGFAGALLADRLADRGIRTAILEAGPRVNRARAFETFLGAVVKTPESPYERSPEADFPKSEDPDHWYRQSGPDKFKSTYLKAVGGTSWHWLGTCVRFLPSDFRLQSRFGRGVDWPIGYDEIEPFYVAAERELGVAGDSADDLGSPRSGPFPMPPIPASWLDGVCERVLADTPWRVRPTPQARNSEVHQGRPACCGSASCIPICPVAAKYDATVHLRRAEAQGAALYEQTTATFVETSDDLRVTAIRFTRADGTRGVARGRVYVLAANAVETPAPAAEFPLGAHARRRRQRLGPGGPQPDGSSHSVELGAGEGPCMAVSRAAIDFGHREHPRRVVPARAVGIANRDRQQWLDLAHRRRALRLPGSSLGAVCEASRCGRPSPIMQRARCGWRR